LDAASRTTNRLSYEPVDQNILFFTRYQTTKHFGKEKRKKARASIIATQRIASRHFAATEPKTANQTKPVEQTFASSSSHSSEN
jgi:hypothetical protein